MGATVPPRASGDAPRLRAVRGAAAGAVRRPSGAGRTWRRSDGAGASCVADRRATLGGSGDSTDRCASLGSASRSRLRQPGRQSPP